MIATNSENQVRASQDNGDTSPIGRPAFATRALYLQVYDKLTALIAGGTWKSGEMIANEIDLAREFGVSVGTMRKALGLMVERRLLTRRQGRGTFIADHQATSEQAFENLVDSNTGLMHWTVSDVEISIVEADDGERAAFGLVRGRRTVIRRHRSLTDEASGTRMLETSSLPQARFPDLRANSPGHEMPIWKLAQAYGYILGSAEEVLSLHQASEQEARRLGSRANAPHLRLARTLFCLEGIPLEWRVGICHPAATTNYLHRFG